VNSDSPMLGFSYLTTHVNARDYGNDYPLQYGKSRFNPSASGSRPGSPRQCCILLTPYRTQRDQWLWPVLENEMRRLLPMLLGRKRPQTFVLLLVVAVIAVIVFLPRAAPQIISTLPRKGVTQITRAVHQEMRREVLPDMSLYSISQLPSSLRRYWSEHIMNIYAQGDGTVSAMTGRRKNGEWCFHASAYLLKRGPERVGHHKPEFLDQ
jgi:hypothetical protein